MGRKGAIVAGAIGAYAFVSFILVKTELLYPGWKKKFRAKFPYSMENIAHRGGSLLGPENTIYTFTKALEEGYADMLELDVRASKDGQPVVSHDSSLGRTCGSHYEHVTIGDIEVGPNPSKTLVQCERSIPICFKTDRVISYEASESIPRDDTTRLCLLSEVFERFPTVPLHVDIKDADYTFVCTVMEMIEQYNRGSTTFVGSSNTDNKPHIKRYLKSCSQEKRKRFRVFANTHEYLISHVYFYLGIMPFVKLEYDVLSAPIWTSTMYRDAVEEYGYLTALFGTYFMTSPTMWRHLRRRGIAVVGWVLNTEKDYAEAARWPLDGVMSDDPVAYHEFLANNERHERRSVPGTVASPISV